MLINKIVGIENRLVTLFDSETEQPLEEKQVAGYTNEFLSSLIEDFIYKCRICCQTVVPPSLW